MFNSRRKSRRKWYSSRGWPVPSWELPLRTSWLALAFAATEYVPQCGAAAFAPTLIGVPLSESMRVITGFLRSTPTSLLHILSGITPPEARLSYTKDLNPKLLLHETLYLKPFLKCLPCRKPLRFFAELLSTADTSTTPIPLAFQSFIAAFGPQPPGCDLSEMPGFSSTA